MTKFAHLSFVLIVALLTARCTGSPGRPSPLLNKGQLEGTWTGTLTLTIDEKATVSPVTVIFSTVPDTGLIGYRSQLRGMIDSDGDASTGWPGTPPTTFQMNHNYPVGTCRGSFNASGQQSSMQHLEADVLVFEVCGRNGRGRLLLDRR